MMAMICRPPESVILKQPVVIFRGGDLALGAQSDYKCGIRVFFGQPRQQKYFHRLVPVQEGRYWRHVDGALCDALRFRDIIFLVALFLVAVCSNAGRQWSVYKRWR